MVKNLEKNFKKFLVWIIVFVVLSITVMTLMILNYFGVMSILYGIGVWVLQLIWLFLVFFIKDKGKIFRKWKWSILIFFGGFVLSTTIVITVSSIQRIKELEQIESNLSKTEKF